ncbi:hypothetical protein L2E82_16949 [Cichorium intybus]|uniref:Uncharacterized protein n=1 Tax=Cichorium intybus TaxID=13427 RepID=A0ACB9F7J0_CICIN|nr:hypothetical protein L2E82_16949 [Cichorium intybus]
MSKLLVDFCLCLLQVLASKLDLLNFHVDLVSLESATKIQLNSLVEEMHAIVKGLEKIKQELAASENNGQVSKVFYKTMNEFINIAELEVESVTNLYFVVVEMLIYTNTSEHEENYKHAELEKKKA